MDNLVLNQIDYKWVDECDDIRQLKKAAKLLKDDGGFFPQLEKHISEKLNLLDKKSIKVEEKGSVISPEDKTFYTNDILNWEKDIKKTDKVLTIHAADVNYKDEHYRAKI